jgi:hypothetical protein
MKSDGCWGRLLTQVSLWHADRTSRMTHTWASLNLKVIVIPSPLCFSAPVLHGDPAGMPDPLQHMSLRLQVEMKYPGWADQEKFCPGVQDQLSRAWCEVEGQLSELTWVFTPTPIVRVGCPLPLPGPLLRTKLPSSGKLATTGEFGSLFSHWTLSTTSLVCAFLLPGSFLPVLFPTGTSSHVSWYAGASPFPQPSSPLLEENEK